MAVFRVEKNKGYTVMSNHHLRNKELSLKAKGLLSQMLSLPEDWDYTLAGLSLINRESIDAIRTAVWELEKRRFFLGVCTCTQRPIQSQNKSRFQSNKAANPLFFSGTSYRTAAFLFAQRQRRDEPCGNGNDCRHASLLLGCHV